MWMLHILLTKLDPESRRLWEKKYIEETATGRWKNAKTPQDFEVEYDNLLSFLKGLLQALERAHRLAGNITYSDSSQKQKGPKKQVGAVATQPGKKSTRCPQCSQEHLLHRCDKFLSQKTKERWANVRQWQICLNCFGSHRASDCTSKFSCKHCKKKHHSLLHYDNKTANAVGAYDSDSDREDESDYVGGAATVTQLPAVPTNTKTDSASNDSPTSGENAVLPGPGTSEVQGTKRVLPARTSGVYMCTILLPVQKPDGSTVSIRAMLDTGSECNVLSEKAAKIIEAEIAPTTTRIYGVGGADGPSVNGKTTLKVVAGPANATFKLTCIRHERRCPAIAPQWTTKRHSEAV